MRRFIIISYRGLLLGLSLKVFVGGGCYTNGVQIGPRSIVTEITQFHWFYTVVLIMMCFHCGCAPSVVEGGFEWGKSSLSYENEE
jgi:hypothetical protein